MNREADVDIVKRYEDIRRRAANGDRTAYAIKMMVEAVMDGKLSEEQLLKISEVIKSEGTNAAYKLFVDFYYQAASGEVVTS